MSKLNPNPARTSSAILASVLACAGTLEAASAFAHAHGHDHPSPKPSSAEPQRAHAHAEAHAQAGHHDHRHHRHDGHEHDGHAHDGHGHDGHGHDAHADGHAHGAHVHGLAHLDAALDGRTLVIAIRSPGWDLVGFERAPRDEAERARIEAARATLADGARLFAFEPAGACRAAEPARVVLPSAIEPEGAAADPGEPGHPGDWTATWTFDCAEPASLRAIRVDWFDAFASTERIEVQWIGPDGQAGHALTAAERRIPVGGR